MDSHAQIIVDFMAEHGITQVEMAQRLIEKITLPGSFWNEVVS